MSRHFSQWHLAITLWNMEKVSLLNKADLLSSSYFLVYFSHVLYKLFAVCIYGKFISYETNKTVRPAFHMPSCAHTDRGREDAHLTQSSHISTESGVCVWSQSSLELSKQEACQYLLGGQIVSFKRGPFAGSIWPLSKRILGKVDLCFDLVCPCLSICDYRLNPGYYAVRVDPTQILGMVHFGDRTFWGPHTKRASPACAGYSYGVTPLYPPGVKAPSPQLHLSVSGAASKIWLKMLPCCLLCHRRWPLDEA